MMLRITIITGIVIGATTVFGQNIGINSTGANPNNSAMLDVVSSDKGILIPRVQLSATNAPAPITSPATSLLIYNIAAAGGGTTAVTPGYYYNAGTSGAPNWKRVSTDGDHWKTEGNAGTVAGTNFLGTTDAIDLQFKTNNTNVMRIKSSTYPTVGIGTAFPVTVLSGSSAVLHVHDGGAEIGSQLILSTHATANNSRVGLINFAATQSATNRIAASIESYLTAGSGANSSGDLRFITSNGTVTPAERFRIPSANQVHAMANGTAALPFYSWGADANTGMSSLAADQLNWSTGGAERLRLTNTQLATTFNGTAGTPAYSFTTDTDLGIYRITTNAIGVSTAGVERLRLTATEAVFNDASNSYNFRIESDAQANMFFIDAGSNEIGIRTAAPSSMLHMTNGGVNVGANAMAFFENLGAEGVSISGYNTGTANGYNGVEGIVSYSGTAFNATGVFGLAISSVFSNTSIGVRGTINGQSGVGVLGTRTNGGGTGWGGLFVEDLGYTGFFGSASDENLKKNIAPIYGALQIVEQLNPVTYDFDLEKNPGMGLNKEMEYGFIAQEVQKVLPEIVREKNLPTNANQELKANESHNLELAKFMVMDYTRIIPILTKAVQEQQTIIKTQNSRIDALEVIVLELQKEIKK